MPPSRPLLILSFSLFPISGSKPECTLLTFLKNSATKPKTDSLVETNAPLLGLRSSSMILGGAYRSSKRPEESRGLDDQELALFTVAPDAIDDVLWHIKSKKGKVSPFPVRTAELNGLSGYHLF